MAVQDDLALAIRETVQPLLKAHGYKGSYPTWTRTSARGDTALVNVQRSNASSGDVLYFIVNLQITSAARMAHVRATWPKPPSRPTIGLDDWRDRLTATVPNRRPGPEAWWLVDGPSTARTSAEDVAMQLERTALPLLEELLDRSKLIDAVRRSGREGNLALLLADEGPSEELDALISTLSERSPGYAAWLRERAEAVRQHAPIR